MEAGILELPEFMEISEIHELLERSFNISNYSRIYRTQNGEKNRYDTGPICEDSYMKIQITLPTKSKMLKTPKFSFKRRMFEALKHRLKMCRDPETKHQ